MAVHHRLAGQHDPYFPRGALHPDFPHRQSPTVAIRPCSRRTTWIVPHSARESGVYRPRISCPSATLRRLGRTGPGDPCLLPHLRSEAARLHAVRRAISGADANAPSPADAVP